MTRPRSPGAILHAVAFATLLGASPTLGGSATDTTRSTTDAPADTTEVAEAAQSARIPGLRGRPDLLQHASLAFAIGVGVGALTDQPATAAGVSVSLGIAKEFSDTRFDRTDLLADVVGAALAAAVTWWISR
jgi:hypothetical protein